MGIGELKSLDAPPPFRDWEYGAPPRIEQVPHFGSLYVPAPLRILIQLPWRGTSMCTGLPAAGGVLLAPWVGNFSRPLCWLKQAATMSGVRIAWCSNSSYNLQHAVARWGPTSPLLCEVAHLCQSAHPSSCVPVSGSSALQVSIHRPAAARPPSMRQCSADAVFKCASRTVPRLEGTTGCPAWGVVQEQSYVLRTLSVGEYP